MNLNMSLEKRSVRPSVSFRGQSKFCRNTVGPAPKGAEYDFVCETLIRGDSIPGPYRVKVFQGITYSA
jgi:hypothetical protein